MKSKLKIIISGGGTGGHIFPALSIANGIKSRFADADILFVGALGRMEMEIVPKNGFPIEGLPVMGFVRKLTFKNVKVLFNLFKSMHMAKKIVKRFQPDIAIGVGGYASGPTLKSAAKLGIPTLLQEQNGYAGVTNKLLAKRAKKICVAYDNMQQFFPADRIVLTGNPVRESVKQISIDSKMAKQELGFNPDLPMILIVGGSLGARTINESVIEKLELLEKQPVQLLWQTGKYYFESIQQEYGATLPATVKAVKFIDSMDVAYAAADLIISRAGAGTISELCIVGKPVILVPSPNVSEDHQTKNAMALVNKKAAVIIKDSDAKLELIQTALDILSKKEELLVLSSNIKELAKPNATSDIVDQVVEVING